MFLFRLIGSPYILRYYPKYRQNMYQYHRMDQNPHLFGFRDDVMELTQFNIIKQCFSSLIDVYLFMTSYMYKIPDNLKDAFEIQNKNNVWVRLKRPLLYAPSLYCL